MAPTPPISNKESTNIEIRRVEIVAATPPDHKRDPHTLYVPISMGTPERDQLLGAFMDQWSQLERGMLAILWPLLGSTFQAAEVLFYSSTTIRTQTDMITGLVALNRPQQASQWRTIKDKCLALSNNRNHLVHGQWVPEATVIGDEKGRPTVKRITWFRIYLTGDPDLNKTAALQSDKPKTGQHRYSFQRIREKIQQVGNVVKMMNAFQKKTPGGVPPSR